MCVRFLHLKIRGLQLGEREPGYVLQDMKQENQAGTVLSKVPEVTLGFWIIKIFATTLGETGGDTLSMTYDMGYLLSSLVFVVPLFGGSLAALEVLRRCSPVSPVLLFWAAFVLTRPLGATLGDFLDKPLAHGGLDLSRPWASSLLACAIVVMVAVLPQRAGRHPG